jgi:hypothetical protein
MHASEMRQRQDSMDHHEEKCVPDRRQDGGAAVNGASEDSAYQGKRTTCQKQSFPKANADPHPHTPEILSPDNSWRAYRFPKNESVRRR